MTNHTTTRRISSFTRQPENPPPEKSKREQELHEAIERVWRRYGNDLHAFQRDAERELEKCSEKVRLRS